MPKLLRNMKVRRAVLQSTFVLVALATLAWCVFAAHRTIDALGMASGFGFLERATGFQIGFSLIDSGSNLTYGGLLWTGLVNTLALGFAGIFFANLIGLAVAMLRLADNKSLNAVGTLYVETFRNVPLILQALFWYAVMTHFPAPRQAEPILDLMYLTSRGIYLPTLGVAAWQWGALLLAVAAAALGQAALMRLRGRAGSTAFTSSTFGMALCVGLAVFGLSFLWRPSDMPWLSVPELRGLNIRGGIQMAPELATMIIAIATYGGAYLAEVFRAGFSSIPRGQVEAARSLGLKRWHVFRKVQLPLAIRAVLPILNNQYVWLMKATTLGIAVGYADFFSVVSISINQSGQTLELIAILMIGFLIINNTISILMNKINDRLRLKTSQNRV